MNRDHLNKYYTCLGLRKISTKEANTLFESVQQFYNISEMSYYHPILNLFTNYFNTDVGLNLQQNIVSINKKISRVKSMAYSCKGKIRTKRGKHYHTEVFIKELPLLKLNYCYLWYNKHNIGPMQKLYYDHIYDLNSQNNIEIFVNYLVTKLDENKLSPHFCKMYGCVRVLMNKFSFDLTDDDEVMSEINSDSKKNSKKLEELIEDTNGIVKKTYDELNLEVKNFPCYLLVTQKSNLDIDFLYENSQLDYYHLKSIIFQILTAIVTMNTVYGIKHNDLHLGNVMLSLTNEKFIIYKINNKIYKVPTFGYCVKLIDWGRATYEFNDFKGDNHIFRSYDDCFKQYVFKRINNKGIVNILPSEFRWTDIVMICHNILYSFKDYRDDDIGHFLKSVIKYEGGELDINEFTWSTYVDIHVYDFNVKPNKLFTHMLFKEYLYKESELGDDIKQKIYTIQL